MGAVVAVAVRFLIVAAAQLGILALWEKIGAPALNAAIVYVATTFGATRTEAEDVVGNEVLAAAEAVGITALTIRSRIPLKAAEMLGFTARGWSKKTIPTILAAKLPKSSIPIVKTAVATVAEKETIAATVAAAKSVGLQRVKDVVTTLGTIIGVPTAFLYMIAQFIDYAAWDGSAFQGTFQKIFAVVGLTPDRSMPDSKILSPEIWDKVNNTYIQAGAVGINDPFKGQTILFSRQALIDLVDKVASAILVDGGTASAKNVLGATTAFVILKKPAASSAVTTPVQSTPVATTPVTTPKPPPTQIKIFSGVVTNGTLGTPTEFIARPDDMIDSPDELKAAAKNNLASFINSLPGRFSYEIAIVNTVKTKSGFTQKGAPVTVITGYYKNGNPKTKTVYHKFAVMKLIVTDENGRIVKLGTINLGPVNAIDYQPTGVEIQTVQNAITPELFTNDVRVIQEVITPENVSVTTTVPANPNPPTQINLMSGDYIINGTIHLSYPGNGITFRAVGDDFQGVVYRATNYQIERISTNAYVANMDAMIDGRLYKAGEVIPRPLAYADLVNKSQSGTYNSTIQDKELWDRQYGAGAWAKLPTYNMGDLQTILGQNGGKFPPIGGQKKEFTTGLSATSLYDFFAANGKELPSLADRSALYLMAGFGAASTYTGTAEQNNRLLAWLKSLV